MAEIKMPGEDNIEKFRNDCETYRKAKERLEKLGINTEQNAIIYLQREVDYYRDKIAHMEEKNRIRTGLLDELQHMSIMPASEIDIKMPILESIPENMRDRITSIEQTADGTVSVRFDKNDMEK